VVKLRNAQAIDTLYRQTSRQLSIRKDITTVDLTK